MTQPIALIIDDEADICQLISMTLGRMKINCDTVGTIAEAKVCLEKNDYDFILTDMRLPDGDGIDLVRLVQDHYSEIPIAVITAYGSMELAILALKAGAFDFVSKPVDIKILRSLVTSALKLSTKSSSTDNSQHQLLGTSDAIDKLRKMITKLSRSQAPVLITGDSGTGKELAARMIHEQGSRSDGPFIPVNCGAIPIELMESEFFGHKKGSFTGATSDELGLCRAANGGTLFLDEIGELSLMMQVKLLRVIQEKAVRPIGVQDEEPIDVRVLSATHKQLDKAIALGEFRQDLFYRINVIELHMPPLSERIEDIPVLTRYFLQKLSQQLTIDKLQLAPSALEALNQHAFPGNVRELENILERAVTLCENGIITKADLQLNLVTDTKNGSLESHMDSVEKTLIIKALQENHGDKTRTAEKLGLSLRALRYRLKKLDIDPREFD